MTREDPSDSPPTGGQHDLVAAAWRQVEQLMSTTARSAGGRGAGGDRLAGGEPEQIAGYRIIAELQRGGQGVVYRGVQESTRREVAIKVMRDGPFAGPRERARFEREVQILAQLKHPNIVTIHDSGVAGRSAYFVMDYIAGEPLDRYVDARSPDLRTRLRMFAKICTAVNVAHLRGVIHRDLKPGNLRIDEQGEPHVLDFGLAKHSALDSGADSGADGGGEVMTVTGQFVGSLPWASPEQAEGRSDQIDLRTDVYSLGVILYQLLTGEFPYEVSGSLGETSHNIIHREARHPRALNRGLDDEVCTIVLKALRKDREERYQTAGALGRDIERYLAGEAIEAKRDSMAYMLRKQLARHKLAAGISAAFIALFIVGFGVSLSFWRQAVIARNAEADRNREAMANAVLAENRASRAATEAAKAEAVSNFLTDMLESASPDRGNKPDVTVREAVDLAAARLEGGAFADQPAVQATVRRVIGATYGALGLYDDAARYLRAAHEQYARAGLADTEEALMCTFRLADALRNQGDLAAAEALFQETLPRAAAHHGSKHVIVAAGLNGLGDVLRDANRLDDAAQKNREALAILRALPNAPDEDIATVLNDLAIVLESQARYDEAVALLGESLALAKQAHGPRHRSVAVALSNRAGVYGDLGRFEEALADHALALEIFREAVGQRHPDVASCLSAMGLIKIKQRSFSEAKPLLADSLAMRRELLGGEHAIVAQGINNLALAEYELGDLESAAEHFAEALAIFRKARGPNHPSLASMLGNLAAVQRTRGRLDAAIPLLREALATHVANLRPGHPQIALAQHNLGRTLLDAGEFEEAEELLRASLSARRALTEGDHVDIASSLDALANVQVRKGALAEAEASANEALAMRRRLVGDEHLDLSQSMQILGLISQARADSATAAEWFSRAVDLAEKHLPAGHWRIGVLQADLGLALSALGKATEAEQMLLAAYASLTAAYGDTDHRTQRVIRELVKHYEAANDTEAARQWQDRLVRESAGESTGSTESGAEDSTKGTPDSPPISGGA